MDTYVTIKIFHNGKEKARWERALDRAIERMRSVDSLCNRYDPDSELSRINRRAGAGWTAVSTDMAELLHRSMEISEITQGCFDPTIGVLMDRYGFGRKDSLDLPSAADLRQLLQRVDYRLLQVRGDSVRLLQPGMLIDLGGIAKGFAMDKAMACLTEFGVTDCQIDVGGEVSTLATGLTAGRRKIYIRDPRQRDQFYGRFPMDQGCVATSGDYERFLLYRGERWHHLLDPATGLPARGCRSATIKTTDNTLCDGLSTAVFVMGPEKGLALVESLPEVEAVILYDGAEGLRCAISSGLQRTFELLNEQD